MRRGGGGFRGGGGRSMGGGGRIGGGRSLGGGAGRSARGMGSSPGLGLGGGLGRPAARPAPRRSPGFGTGLGVGMGLGMMGRRRRGWGWGGGWGRRGMGMHGGMGMGPRGGCGGGCMGVIMAVIMLIIVLTVISMVANVAVPDVGGRTQVTRSTVNRTALARDRADTSVPNLVDDLRWIDNTALLNRGMSNFHNRTGVRPILYITGSIDGNTNPSFAQISAYADRRYTELTGGCEAHVLLLIFESNTMEEAYVRVGAEARVVIDEEAYNIILDYVVRHWGSRMNEDELFSRVFDESSTRIMRVDRSPWIPVLIVACILLILFLLFNWWKRKQEQKNREAEETERILNQPLEAFGSDDVASQLAQQYEDDNQNN